MTSQPHSGTSSLDERDWEELRTKLEKAVGRVCPPWMAASKQDLIQIALVRVMNLDRKSEGNRSLSSSYLMKVAYSALVDEIRRHRRRRETDLTDEDHTTRWSSDDPSPERTAEGGELGRAIEDCLKGLIEPRRLAVALHLRGHGVPEAAQMLDWPRKRTENLVYRGLGDLRTCLSGKGYSP